MRWSWYPKNQFWWNFPYQTTIMDGRKPGFFSIYASGLSICSGWIIAFSAPRLLDSVDAPWTKKQRKKNVGNLPFVSRKERNFWASQKCGDFFVMFWNFIFFQFGSLSVWWISLVGFMKAATGFTNKFGPQRIVWGVDLEDNPIGAEWLHYIYVLFLGGAHGNHVSSVLSVTLHTWI